VYFSIIARGARGGKGADGMGISKGATAIAVVELTKHQQLHILVGQEGGDACRKVRVFEIKITYGRQRQTSIILIIIILRGYSTRVIQYV